MAKPAKPSLKLRFGDLLIDLERYRVLLDDEPVAIPYLEYALLVYLAGRSGQPVSRRKLLEEGLGRHDPAGLRKVDEHIRHIKHMLEREGRLFIEDCGDAGYRLIKNESIVHSP